MGLLSLSNLEICINKAEFSDFLKVRLSLGLLNTYKTIYFDGNISEIRMAKKSEGSFLSYKLNEEIYFSVLSQTKYSAGFQQ